MEHSFQPNPMDHLPQEPAPQTPHQATRQHAAKRKKILLLGAIGAAVLLLLAAAVAWFVLKKSDTSTPTSKNPSTQQQTEEQPSAQTQPDATPIAYKSAKLNIEITHRKDWTLKEATSGELTLTSPATTYTKANATAGTSVFTVKIRKGVPEAMKATIDKAIAVRDSEVIAYTAPTESQRQYTNVSYGGSGENFNFFIVTGSVEFKAGKPFQYALTLGEDTYLLAGGYGTDKDGTLTFDPVPKGSLGTDVMAQAIDIVESLKIF